MGFFISSWAGRIVLLFGGGVVVVAGAAAVILGLAVTGGPGECTPGGGPIVVSAANAESFQQKWDVFDAALDGGSSATVTFDESELTSRANTWIEEEETDFQEVQICIHEGYGEATASLDLPGFIDTKIKVTGRVELTGGHPVADIDDMEIGNVPGPALGVFEGLAEDAIDEALNKIDVEHSYVITLTEGSAKIDGLP